MESASILAESSEFCSAIGFTVSSKSSCNEAHSLCLFPETPGKTSGASCAACPAENGSPSLSPPAGHAPAPASYPRAPRRVLLPDPMPSSSLVRAQPPQHVVMVTADSQRACSVSLSARSHARSHARCTLILIAKISLRRSGYGAGLQPLASRSYVMITEPPPSPSSRHPRRGPGQCTPSSRCCQGWCSDTATPGRPPPRCGRRPR